MSFTKTMMASAIAMTLAIPAIAEGIMVHDSYFRTAGAMARSGAAFMQLMNHTDQDDRLIAASSDVAKRVELHTHVDMGEGVMKMTEVEGGFPIPAGGMHLLERGADHVMFMGLTREIKDGEIITATFTFEKAGDMVVEIPVDLNRKPAKGMQHGHGMMQTETDESAATN